MIFVVRKIAVVFCGPKQFVGWWLAQLGWLLCNKICTEQHGSGDGVHPLLPASSGGRSAAVSPSGGRDQARPGPPAGTCAPQQPPNSGIWRGWRRLTPEVVVRGDFQRRGGARERRGSVAMRRRWVRIRSITRGWVRLLSIQLLRAGPHQRRESSSFSSNSPTH